MQSFLRHSIVWVLFVFWLLPVGLSAAPKPTDVVAEIDGFRITVADVRKKLSDGNRTRSGSDADELKQEAVNDLINEYLVKIRARSVPVESDPAFMQRADHLLSQLATREVFNREVVSLATVSDTEMVQRYRQKPEQYQLKEWVRARHILVAPTKDTLLLTARQKETGWWADSDAKAKPIVDSLYRMIMAGFSFDSLARHWSQDMASGIKGGDLGIFSRGQMVPEFDSVSFLLPVGTVSAPVKTQFGYHLIKVTSRQEQKTAPLNDSLKQLIKQQMLNEKIIDRSFTYLDSLHQAAGLVFNETVLKMPDSVRPGQKIWALASRFGDTVWSDRFATQLGVARSIAPPGKKERDLRIDLLKELVTPQLIRRVIQDLKITESEVYRARKEQIFQNEKMDRVLKEAAIEYNPTPDEVKVYYQKRKTDFMPAESVSVHVQQMVFKTKAEVEQALRELGAGADFALLARKYFQGDADIAQEAFDLGFISPPAMPKTFFSVAETLSVGSVSRPVKTQWGYHLMRVLARRPDLSFEAARPKIVVAIRKAKQEEHKRKWETSLREGHTISINDRILRRIKYEPSQADNSSRP